MARPYQQGCLVQKPRKGGIAWVLRNRQYRASDGKRVEVTPIFVGYVKELPSEAAARRKLKSLNINLNQPGRSLDVVSVTFGDLARHYLDHELPANQENAAIPKAHSTVETYTRYLKKWIIPRWDSDVASTIEPLHVEHWLRELGNKRHLENRTRDKIRRVMTLVFKHGQRHGYLSRGEEGNPMRFVRQSTMSSFNPIILTLAEASAILDQLDLMKRTLVLVIATTALRISEVLALQWKDVNFDGHEIQVSKAWVFGRFGEPKSRASKRPVPLHPLLAAHLITWRKDTPYAHEDDFVFPSFKLKGRKPPRANMLLSDHLKPAALRAGVKGNVGFHTFRRTLASHLVANNYDPKLAQELLRHSNIRTTLEIYAQAITPAKLEAQGTFLRWLLGKDAQLGSSMLQ